MKDFLVFYLFLNAESEWKVLKFSDDVSPVKCNQIK